MVESSQSAKVVKDVTLYLRGRRSSPTQNNYYPPTTDDDQPVVSDWHNIFDVADLVIVELPSA